MRASQPALPLKRYQICQNTVPSYCILFALNTLILSLLFLQVLYVAISTMFFHVVKNWPYQRPKTAAVAQLFVFMYACLI